MKMLDLLPLVQNVADPKAALCGHRDFVGMSDFCSESADAFKDLFGIDRIPSHDTFNRVFKIIDPDFFEAAYRQAAGMAAGGGVVALDGKQPRGSALLAVSAWSSAGGLFLATEYVDSKLGKGSELPAMLALVEAVLRKGGDYLFALKDNQRLSHEWARASSSSS